MALAYTVRDRMLERWVSTVRTYAAQDVKVVCYLSAEFLIGPQLGNNLVNLGIEANARAAMEELGQDLDALLAIEEEPGLGNGGLGRLAACYLDSLATLEVPAIGYGLRYEFGIFDQEIRDGCPGRGHRQVAAEGQSVGDPAPGRLLLRQLRRPYRELHRRGGALPGALDPGEAGQGHGLRHPGARLPRQHLQHPPAVEERSGRIRSTSRTSTSATTTARSRRRWSPRRSRRCSIRMTSPRPGERLRLAQQYFFVSCSLQDMLRLLDLQGRPDRAPAGARSRRR